MAGAGFKTFNTGDVLLASEVNTYLMQQTVMVFDDAAARTTALTGVVAEGMLSYLKDTNAVERYDGSAWGAIGAGDIEGVTAGTGISGGGSSGTVTITNSMATAIDAKGDLIVGTGADTFDRLAVGTNGYTLVADSGETTGLKWAAGGSTFSGVVCRLGTAISISNNTGTIVNFDTEIVDSDGYHSTTTNTSRLTVPAGKAGKYFFFATAMFDANGTGGRDASVRLNGSTYIGGSAIGNSGAALNASPVVARVYDFVVGDYIELDVFQNSGGNLDVKSGLNTTVFGMYLIGA